MNPLTQDLAARTWIHSSPTYRLPNQKGGLGGVAVEVVGVVVVWGAMLLFFIFL